MHQPACQTHIFGQSNHQGSVQIQQYLSERSSSSLKQPQTVVRLQTLHQVQEEMNEENILISNNRVKMILTNILCQQNNYLYLHIF